MQRRGFLKHLGAGAAFGLAASRRDVDAQSPVSAARPERDAWTERARRLADPVLRHLAAGTLRARMPVEQAAGADRRDVTHLEAVGRLLSGIAPWLELDDAGTPDSATRAHYAAMARDGLTRALEPSAPDALNFTRGPQPLVDAAFLGQAMLRAPRALRDALDPTTRRRLVAALESTRAIQPGFNNWLLFSATVEATLASLGATWDRMRIDYALRQHEQWYKGDGHYGDGPAFHCDYYNSFVIQPMLVDVLVAVGDQSTAWTAMRGRVESRARRYAAVQERLVAPDGSFPAIGRSLAYRCGAFHLLAQAAWRHALPDGTSPAQVRGALGAAMRRTLDAPGTFDEDGWLRIGLCGHQPGVGENYISTGSLYLCATVFLPLGLPPEDPFWRDPDEPWTAARAWSGRPFPIDHALAE